jgi:hypothetical protein
MERKQNFNPLAKTQHNFGFEHEQQFKLRHWRIGDVEPGSFSLMTACRAPTNTAHFAARLSRKATSVIH